MNPESEPTIIANQAPGFQDELQNELAIKSNSFLGKFLAVIFWGIASFSIYELIKFIAASISEPELFYSLESFPIKTFIGGEDGPTVIFGPPLAYLIPLSFFYSILFSLGGWYCWMRDYKKQGISLLLFILVNFLFLFLTSGNIHN
jgi:hypothetical protein